MDVASRSIVTKQAIEREQTSLQVKFVHEAFRKLRPGVPLAMLHGKLKQKKRMAVFYTFNQSKASVLFATDIAARGLDFPAVDWVVQADCPEDADAYIHRVGRTARFQAGGCCSQAVHSRQHCPLTAVVVSQCTQRHVNTPSGDL